MDVTLTDRELEIMLILWELGSGTVTEVRERMADDLAYTTVLSFLRTMHEKGHVRHVAEGRAHRFIPRVRREAVNRGAVARLVDRVFGGSSELAVLHLVSDRRLDEAELRRIRALIDERLPKEE